MKTFITIIKSRYIYKIIYVCLHIYSVLKYRSDVESGGTVLKFQLLTRPREEDHKFKVRLRTNTRLGRSNSVISCLKIKVQRSLSIVQ